MAKARHVQKIFKRNFANSKKRKTQKTPSVFLTNFKTNGHGFSMYGVRRTYMKPSFVDAREKEDVCDDQRQTEIDENNGVVRRHQPIRVRSQTHPEIHADTDTFVVQISCTLKIEMVSSPVCRSVRGSCWHACCYLLPVNCVDDDSQNQRDHRQAAADYRYHRQNYFVDSSLHRKHSPLTSPLYCSQQLVQQQQQQQ